MALRADHAIALRIDQRRDFGELRCRGDGVGSTVHREHVAGRAAAPRGGSRPAFRPVRDEFIQPPGIAERYFRVFFDRFRMESHGSTPRAWVGRPCVPPLGTRGEAPVFVVVVR
jgi:hypothetical protein